MFSRDGAAAGLAAGAGFAAGAVVLAGATAFGFRILAGALVCWGAEPGGFDAAFLFGAAFFADFVFADFLTDFLPDFFTAGFLAAFFDFLVVFLLVFLLVFLAAFLAVFFAAAVLFLARFFGAALAARGDTFFAFFFLEGFFLAATTNSFKCSNKLVGIDIRRSAYRVASASIENTEKTSGFRSRLYDSVSRAARTIFSHTSASRARRGRFALASPARSFSPIQRSMPSMKAASATRSLVPSASPSACSSRGSTRGSVANNAAVRCCSFNASPPSRFSARPALPSDAAAVSASAGSSAA